MSKLKRLMDDLGGKLNTVVVGCMMRFHRGVIEIVKANLKDIPTDLFHNHIHQCQRRGG